MRAGRLVLTVAAGVMLAAPALLTGGNALAATGDGWGTAFEVPGTAALNAGGQDQLTSMSCPSSGNCVAGGWYTDASGKEQAFVVDETGGVWDTAIEVPGTAALNTGRDAQVASVSCSSPGNCAAGGVYSSGEAFVADEVGGVWGNAIEVPGTAALNAGDQAEVVSVSCPAGAGGNCAVTGLYRDSSQHPQPFVANEASGVWGNAIEVPGTAALSGEKLALPIQVSCPTAGNCTVGGEYFNSSANTLPFVARQRNGAWGQAMELPGIAALAQGSAGLAALSCTSAGNCEAAGAYTLGTGQQLFVAAENNGTWAPAAEMPGIATLDAGQSASVNSMSCTSSGNCAAAGSYKTSTGIMLPFVANETAGAWGQPIEVPGLAPLTEGGSAAELVSCSLAGDCVVGGFYRRQAFVANEFAGVWDRALLVPGTKTLNTGFNAEVSVVSCARAGTCALGGFYDIVPKNFTPQVFIDTRR
jgi:hypothetical protein